MDCVLSVLPEKALQNDDTNVWQVVAVCNFKVCTKGQWLVKCGVQKVDKPDFSIYKQTYSD
jgi:hypothetical protein